MIKTRQLHVKSIDLVPQKYTRLAAVAPHKPDQWSLRTFINGLIFAEALSTIKVSSKKGQLWGHVYADFTDFKWQHHDEKLRISESYGLPTTTMFRNMAAVITGDKDWSEYAKTPSKSINELRYGPDAELAVVQAVVQVEEVKEKLDVSPVSVSVSLSILPAEDTITVSRETLMEIMRSYSNNQKTMMNVVNEAVAKMAEDREAMRSMVEQFTAPKVETQTAVAISEGWGLGRKLRLLTGRST